MKKLLSLSACLLFISLTAYLKAQPPTTPPIDGIKVTYVDLAISDFRITSITPQAVKYTCTITNIGDKTATIPSGVTLQVWFHNTLENAQKQIGPGGGATSMITGSLSPGESATRTFQSTANHTSYKLCSLELDRENKVSEATKQNNRRFATVPL